VLWEFKALSSSDFEFLHALLNIFAIGKKQASRFTLSEYGDDFTTQKWLHGP